MSQTCNRCYCIVPRACQSDAEYAECTQLQRDPPGKWTVGKNGKTPLRYFNSHDDAAEYISTVLEKKDPAGVYAGDYYLDPPEEM